MDIQTKFFVYGGAFDPPTVAHETIIKDLFDRAAAQAETTPVRIVFGVTNNDEKKYSADISHRIAMMSRLAEMRKRSSDKYAKVDYLVVKQEERLYSWLEKGKLHAWLEHSKLLTKDTTVVLGMDEWLDLYSGYTWRNAAELKETVSFLVYKRHTSDLREYKERGTNDPTISVTRSDLLLPPASSSDAREEMRLDPYSTPIMLSPDIRGYISENGLYGQVDTARRRAEERHFIDTYTAKDYPRPSVTATVVVHTDREILLVRRKGFPFKDHWCLPGGFAEPFETIEEAAMRELSEEISLDPAKCNDTKFKQLGVYTPNDPRFSKDTGCWAYDVGLSLHVRDYIKSMLKAADDAVELMWLPFDKLDHVRLAFHHKLIVNEFRKSPFDKIEPIITF